MLCKPPPRGARLDPSAAKWRETVTSNRAAKCTKSLLLLPSFSCRLPGRHPYASTTSHEGFRRLLNSAPPLVYPFCRGLACSSRYHPEPPRGLDSWGHHTRRDAGAAQVSPPRSRTPPGPFPLLAPRRAPCCRFRSIRSRAPSRRRCRPRPGRRERCP